MPKQDLSVFENKKFLESRLKYTTLNYRPTTQGVIYTEKFLNTNSKINSRTIFLNWFMSLWRLGI